MPITYQCRACGCAISERQLRGGEAKRDGSDIYCVECSTLISEPAEQVTGGTNQPLDMLQAATPPYGQPLSQRPAGSGRRPSPETPRQQGSGLNAAPHQVASSGRAAGSSARQPAPASGASSARRPAPSARQQAAVQKPSARNVKPAERRRVSAQRVEPEARHRPSSHRMQPGGRRASAKQVEPAPPASASRRATDARASRRLQASPTPEYQEQNVEYSAGTSRMRPTRSSAEQREQADDRRGRYSARSTAAGEEKSKATLIVMIAGGLVVIGLVALLAGVMGSSKNTGRGKRNDGPTPQEYVRMAEEELRKGNKMNAFNLFKKASDGWSEIGQDEEARQCMMRAKSVGFSTTINDYRK